MQKYSAGSILVLALLLGVIYFLQRHDADDDKEREQAKQMEAVNTAAATARISLTALDLLAAYDENEVAADQKYKGKPLQVTGTIDGIGKDITDELYVTLKGSPADFRSVQCYFPKTSQQALAALKKGMKVTIAGNCDGLMMNVLIKDCSIKQTPPGH